MKITKKELFKFCDDNNDAINELQSQSDSTDLLLAVLIQQLKDSGVIDEVSPEPKPQLKQLGQSVFDGEPEQIKWAVVTKEGAVLKLEFKPVVKDGLWHWTGGYRQHSLIGQYDASNWQNSLIERDIAKELLEVDLSSELTGSDLARAMLARGDKCVMIRMGARDDKQARDIGRFAIATGIDESGRFNVMSDQQPISKADFAIPVNNQGEPLTASEVGL